MNKTRKQIESQVQKAKKMVYKTFSYVLRAKGWDIADNGRYFWVHFDTLFGDTESVMFEFAEDGRKSPSFMGTAY
jgi:hypothetical protein